MAGKMPSEAGYPGHDEGSNRPPNAPDGIYKSSGSTFAPLDQSGDNGLNQKTNLGTTGKVEGQE